MRIIFYTPLIVFNVPHVSCPIFTVSRFLPAFPLFKYFQSRCQVVLGKVKSVKLVLRIEILKILEDNFGSGEGRLVMGGDACWNC